MNWEFLKGFQNKNDRRVAGIALAIIFALAIFFLVLAILAGYWRDWNLLLFSIATCLWLAIPGGFILARHLHTGMMILTGGITITITVILTFGQGIHDIGMMAYPVLILIASQMMPRRSYLLLSILVFGAVTWLILGEAYGLVVPKPYGLPGWADFLVLGMILCVAILFMDALSKSLLASEQMAEQATDKMLESEEKYRDLVENIGDTLFAIDFNGNFLFISRQIRQFGYEPEQLVGKNMADVIQKYIHPEDQLRVAAALQEIYTRETGRPLYFRVMTHNGQIRWMEETARVQRDQKGNVVGLKGMMRDVTAQQEAERTAKIISGFQAAILETHNLKDIYALVSEKVHELIGNCITSISMLDDSSQTFQNIAFHGIDLSILEKAQAIFGLDYLEKPYPISDFSQNQMRTYCSGRLEYMEDGLYSMLSAYVPHPVCRAVENLVGIRGVYAMGIVHQDIPIHLGLLVIMTKSDIGLYKSPIEQIVHLASLAINRMRMENTLQQSEITYRGILDTLDESVYVLDEQGVFIDVNKGAERMYRCLREDLIGKTPAAISAEGRNNLDFVAKQLREAYQGAPRVLEFWGVRKNGQEFPKEVHLYPGHYFDRQVVIAIAQDITQRKQAEEKILATLEEKETLLREIHHRVKNNLQVMSALIKMRMNMVSEPATKQSLKDLEGQVHTMSLVYEQLYQEKNLSHVNMGSYIKQLISNVLIAFGRSGSIQVEFNTSILLDVVHAIPCGMIVNELFTNILKYAFPADFSGSPAVHILLTKDGDTCNLNIGDNGVGLPPGFDWRSSQSLGLRLVNLWVTHQLGGELQVSSDAGTCYQIRFDVKG